MKFEEKNFLVPPSIPPLTKFSDPPLCLVKSCSPPPWLRAAVPPSCRPTPRPRMTLIYFFKKILFVGIQVRDPSVGVGLDQEYRQVGAAEELRYGALEN